MNIDKGTEVRPYLTTLTPLRGIAAICVVLHHSSLFFGPFLPGSFGAFFENSWIWVDFFFILSGFILSYSYGSYFKDTITFSAYKKYIGARFARIYPLHFITLIWAFVVAAVILYGTDSVNNSISALLNLNALFPCLILIHDLHLYTVSPLNFPSWSLSAEWWMYLLFPFLVPYFYTLTKPKGAIALFVIVALYLFIRYVLGPASATPPGGQPTIDVVADFGIFRCIAGFCVGMFLFAFYQSGAASTLLRKSWLFVLSFSITFIAIGTNVTDIAIVSLFPVVLLTAAYNETAVKKFFDQRILQRLGDWSFSIYMVHGPVILMLLGLSVYRHPNLYTNVRAGTVEAAAQQIAPNYKIGLIYSVVILTVTLAVSAFTYKFLEIPTGKYLKKFFRAR